MPLPQPTINSDIIIALLQFFSQKHLTNAVSNSIIEQILYIKALKKNGQDGYIQRVGGWCEPTHNDWSVSFLSRVAEDYGWVGDHGCPVIMAKSLTELWRVTV